MLIKSVQDVHVCLEAYCWYKDRGTLWHHDDRMVRIQRDREQGEGEVVDVD